MVRTCTWKRSVSIPTTAVLNVCTDSVNIPTRNRCVRAQNCGRWLRDVCVSQGRLGEDSSARGNGRYAFAKDNLAEVIPPVAPVLSDHVGHTVLSLQICHSGTSENHAMRQNRMLMRVATRAPRLI